MGNAVNHSQQTSHDHYARRSVGDACKSTAGVRVCVCVADTGLMPVSGVNADVNVDVPVVAELVKVDTDRIVTDGDTDASANGIENQFKDKDQEEITEGSPERNNFKSPSQEKKPLEKRKQLLRLRAFSLEDDEENGVPISSLAELYNYKPHQVCCTAPTHNPDLRNLVPYLRPTLSGSTIAKRRKSNHVTDEE